jgi:hypothetical protein
MGLEGIIVALNLVTILIQLFAWRWASRIADNLREQEGFALAQIIAKLVGGLTIARLIGLSGIFFYDRSSLDPVLTIAAFSSLIGVLVLVWAIWEVQQLSGHESPVDRSSKTMVESDAEPAA